MPLKEKIRLEDYFEFGENKAIQRLAYSKDDVEYKAKILKKMKELGLEIKIDRIGNICATLKGNGNSNKSILMGSHTDSVENGGQYDGPVGVVSGLKVLEDIVDKKDKGELDLDCDLKVVVWACEESNRFGKACLGSKWIDGTLEEKDFEMKEKLNKKEEDKCTLGQAVSEYMSEIKELGIDGIKYVDRILTPEEIFRAYELHIEQYQYLEENDIDIGIISSIVAPYRMEVIIDGKDKVLQGAELAVKLNEKAKLAEKLDKYRATIPIINIVNETNENPDFSVEIKLLGETAHSGATPMNKRKDAVLAASRFVTRLNERIREEDYDFKVYFNEIHTKNDSMNKVSGESEIKLGIDTDNLSEDIIIQLISILAEEVGEQEGVKTICKKSDIKKGEISKLAKHKQSENKMNIDVRMQDPTKAEDMFLEISTMISDISHETGGSFICRKTDKAEPVKTPKHFQEQVESVCEERGVKAEVIPSWAGHDVAHINIEDIMLLFIKSTGGSHNPNENTTSEAIENGISVLQGTVQKDIENLHTMVLKIKNYDNSILNVESKTNKGMVRRALFGFLEDLREATKMGIEIPEEMIYNVKRKIISNKNDLEK